MDEIRIHRKKRVVYVNGTPAKLSQGDYDLITAFGVSDNRLVPHEVLLDVMCEGRVQIPADKYLLQVKVSKLRKRLGADVLQNCRGQGYVLSGDVRFVG